MRKEETQVGGDGMINSSDVSYQNSLKSDRDGIRGTQRALGVSYHVEMN